MMTTKLSLSEFERLQEECRKPEKMGLAAAMGKVTGFCVVCGELIELPLSETVGHCNNCGILRRCYNPFREVL